MGHERAHRSQVGPLALVSQAAGRWMEVSEHQKALAPQLRKSPAGGCVGGGRGGSGVAPRGVVHRGTKGGCGLSREGRDTERVPALGAFQEERLAVEEGLVSFGSLGLWGRSREVQLERHRGRLAKREDEIRAVFICRSRRKDAQGCTKR